MKPKGQDSDPSLIHPLADVMSDFVGERTRVWQYVVILEGAEIGFDCNICSHVFVESDVKIGNRVTIKNGCQIWDGVVIEDDVFVGPNVTFTNDKYPASRRRPKKFLGTVVREGASLGGGAVLLPGIEVGRFAIVGAGAVVTSSVPDYAIVAGNPARKIGTTKDDNSRGSFRTPGATE